MPERRLSLLPALALALPGLLASCSLSQSRAGSVAAEPGAAGQLPPVTLRTGPLQLRVVYPGPSDQVDARDSTFVFGSTGNGSATLEINGTPVPVAPNGAWLAWLAIPPDSVFQLTLTARSAGDSATLVHPVRRVRRYRPPEQALWIDSTSFAPSGRAWWPADEFLPISVRAAEGATVRLLLPGGASVPLTPEAAADEVPWGIRAFDRDTGNLVTPRRATRYLGALRGRALGGDPGPLLGPADSRPCRSAATVSGAPDSLPPCPAPVLVEAARNGDTVRVAWNLRLALLDSLLPLVEFNDDTAGEGTGDSLTVGRARPGATYHWFFPTGTRTSVSGRLGDDLRVRLSRGQEAWVPVADAQPLPARTPSVRATVGSVTLTPAADRLSLRLPLSFRVPFRVEEEPGRLTLRLYGSVSDINWTRYGRTDPYLRDIHWLQATGDEVTVTLDLAGPVWGYRTRWSGTDLLFEIRRPPAIDPARPLAGRLIVVDPGHPPLGATGPTGLREAQANLGVALVLAELLSRDGARVVMTRTGDTSLDLLPRVKLADSIGAELLVSIHNNALPDGVNPFTNNGASVFYNHPQSLPLARAVQAELVRRLGVRDLGVGRGDLALVRPTWMPAILTEGLFMMIPEQEAALANPEGQQRYAVAVRDGIVMFLRGVARDLRDVP